MYIFLHYIFIIIIIIIIIIIYFIIISTLHFIERIKVKFCKEFLVVGCINFKRIRFD